MDEEELNQLIEKMIKGGESEEAIAMVVRTYSKPVKSEKKKSVASTSKETESESEQKVGSSDGIEAKGFPKTKDYRVGADFVKKSEDEQFDKWLNTNKDVLAWKKEFKKSYGKEPEIEGSDYDYKGAWKAGITPKPTYNPETKTTEYHWGSIGMNGEDLKSKNHPTRWKSDYMKLTGENPDTTGVTKEQALIKLNKNTDTPERRSIFAKKADDLGRGSMQLGANFASIPELTYQIFSAPQNAIADIFDMPSLHTDPDKFKKSLGIKNHIKDHYLEEIEKSREHSKKVDKYYEKGIYDSFASGDIAGGFDLVSSSFLESLPATISMMVGGAYVKSAELLAASTMFFGAGKNEELRREHPEMSTEARTANALGSGLAEGAGELLGSGSIGAAARGLIEREGVKKGLTLLKDGLQKITINAIKKNPLIASMGVEGFEEWSTTVAQNAVGVATGEKPHDYNIFTGAADSFIGGAFGGGVFGGGMKGVQAYVDRSDRISFKKNNTAIFELAREAENPSHSAATKSQIKSSIDQLIKNNQVIIKKGIANVETLSPELKEKYVESVEKLETIKERVAEIRDHETYSPETKKIMLAQLQLEAKEAFELRKNIIEGNTTTVDVLPLKEQNELQKQARESLVAELNPDGTKDLTLTNEQILKRANEIYAKSRKDEAKAAKKAEEELANQEAVNNPAPTVLQPLNLEQVVIPDDVKASVEDASQTHTENITSLTTELEAEKKKNIFKKDKKLIKKLEEDIKFHEDNKALLRTDPVQYYKNFLEDEKQAYNERLLDEDVKQKIIANFGTADFEVVNKNFIESTNKKIAQIEEANKPKSEAEAQNTNQEGSKLTNLRVVENGGEFTVYGDDANGDLQYLNDSGSRWHKTKEEAQAKLDEAQGKKQENPKAEEQKTGQEVVAPTVNNPFVAENEANRKRDLEDANDIAGSEQEKTEWATKIHKEYDAKNEQLSQNEVARQKDLEDVAYIVDKADKKQWEDKINKEYDEEAKKIIDNFSNVNNSKKQTEEKPASANMDVVYKGKEYRVKEDGTIVEIQQGKEFKADLVKGMAKAILELSNKKNETTPTTNTTSDGANGVGTSTNGTQGQNNSVQSSVDNQTSKGEASVDTDSSVMVAPYFSKTINNLSEAKPLRETSGYKKHVKMLHSVAKKLGLKITEIEDTIGGFIHEDGTKITEVSHRVHFDTNDLNKAEEFAALVGALAHETQEATVAAQYVEEGSPNQKAFEIEIKVDNVEKALKVLEEAGIVEFEANEKKGTIKILDFANGRDLDFNAKISNFVKELTNNNISHEKAKARAIDSRYVTTVRRTELLQGVGNNLDKRQGGQNVRNLYKTATAKNEEFLAKKKAIKESAAQKPKPVVEKTEEEIDLEYALSEIDKGVLTWNGDMKVKRVNLGLTWHDIRKGQDDLSKGRVNTVPAKRLIEALKDAKEAGGYNYIKGQGTTAISTFVKFENAEKSAPTFAEKVSERIDLNNASVDDLVNIVKGIDTILGIRIKVDDIDGLNKNGVDIIDVIASVVKQLMAAGIVIDEAIKVVVEKYKEKINFDINIDDIKARVLSGQPKNKTSDSSQTEAFRDKIKDMPQSGNFSKYLSGETIEEEHSPTRNNQAYEVVLLEDMGKHGVEAVEMAKEVFGDEYVEKTLDFLEKANLKAHEAALMYVSLENEMHKRVLADPNNVGEKKLQDLVRAKSQKHLNISAVAINAGRLRAIMKDGYIPDVVSSRMYSNKQKTAKKKLQKAVEATADEINDEAEQQEQETEDELNEEDYAFEITPPKEKRNVKTVKAELKDVFAKMRADALKAAKGGKGTFASVPYAAQLAAVAPHILKAAKLLAEIGGFTTRQIIETIHEEFRKTMPSLSKKDVADSLRNGQKKKGGKPSPEAQRKLYVNRLRKDIAELDKQIVNRKKVVRKRNATYDNDPEITDLREIKKAMQEELAKADPAYGEANKLKADLKAAQQSLDNWETKIRNNDFTAAERSAKPVDQELQKLRDKRDAKRAQYQDKKAAYEKSFITPEMIAEKKLNARVKVVKKTIADLKEKLANPTLNNNAGRSSYWSNELSNLEKEAADLRKQIADNKKALINPESIAEKKVKAKIDAINKSIADLQDKIDNPRENTNAGKNSLWTKEIGELKQKQAELQKILADRKKAAQLQNAKAPLTAEEKLANAKQRVRTRIEELQEQIADKKAVLKYTKKNTDAELKALEAEERELKKEAQKYLSDADKTLLEERKKEAIAIGLETQIAEIDKQIADGVKKAVEAKKDPLENPRINQLKAEKKAKLAILEAIDPTPKEFIKQALIEAGFGREITVNTKNGKEKRQTIDWKKLAGEEGSVDKIRERVEQALKDKGFSQAEIERMKDAFEEEYNNLRAGIIQKGLNELENRNAFKKKVNTKSASKRLAELYNYGLFEKEAGTYDRLMNSALGFSEFDHETFEELKALARSVALLHNSGTSELGISIPITSLNKAISRVLTKAHLKRGIGHYILANIVSEYIGLSTRFMLYNLGQIIENPISGYVQRAVTTVGYAVTGRVDNQELKAQRRKIARARSKSITRDGGNSYGDTTSLLVHESQLESWANKHYDNETAHRIISLYMGRGHLEAYDSRHKTMLTEFYFIQNLAKILTDKTNPNRMSKIEAENFITEKLTGQSFDNALFKAAEITKNINDDAGKKILNDNPRSLAIFAQEIMKDALLEGEMMTIEQTEAAYKAAYMTAGRDIGHVANNIMSRAVGQTNAFVGKQLEKAIQEENWELASWFTLGQMFTRNILFTFVGGGTNWVVLQLQKSNIATGSISLLDDWAHKKGKELDLTSDEGTKALEETLYRSLNYKNTAIRTITGTMVGIMMAGAAAATGADDELLKWLKKNPWAKKYFDKLSPDLLLFWLANKEGKLEPYFKQLVNAKVNLFDNSYQLKEALASAFDKKGSNGGAAGKLVGGKLNAPAPFRAVRDVRNVYNGLTGLPQIKSDFKATSFANGFFQGGLIDYLGFRPEGNAVSDKEQLKRPERPETPERAKRPKRPKS